MLGLPAHPGHVGAVLLAAGILLGLALAPLAWRRIRGEVGLAAAAVLLTVACQTTLAAAPFIAWRVVEDVRYTSRITPAQAARIGGDMSQLDPRAFAWLAAGIPRGDTFYVDVPPAVEAERAKTIGYWADYRLLPRIRVLDPAAADWIVGWGRRPAAAGLRLGAARVLRVPGGEAPGVYYLAPVER